MLKLDTKEELAISSQGRIGDSKTCESLAYIPMKISTPISLKPCIKQLPITACISGEPVLEQTSCGSFILTQELCIKIPIEIRIESNIGELPTLSCPEMPRVKTNPNVVIGNKHHY